MGRLAVWLWCFSAAAAPVLTKVDPPSWRLTHAPTTIRLLLRGSGLRDADVHGARGLDIIQVRPNEAGSYLFVDAKLQRTGSYNIKVSTHQGSASIPFQVLDPLPAKGRFQGFSSNDLLYLIMTDRFADGDPTNDDPEVSRGLFDRSKPGYYHGGDFQGIIDHLGYLHDLGVSGIWITPAYDNTNTLGSGGSTGYHGYHPVDYYGVEEHFGTLEKLREMVDKAHQNGIKVILDTVMNHTGAMHPWVEDPPLDDWYHGSPEKHLNETYQIWTLLDPHASFTMRDPVLYGWFANELPDLNQEEPEVATYLIQNTLWWIANTGIDGMRADAMPYVPRKFWSRWNEAIKKEFPDFETVGEAWDSDPAIVSFFQGGAKGYDGIDTGMDALYDFPLFGAVRGAFAEKKPVANLAYVTGHDALYPKSNNLFTFLGNHDVKRFLNEPGATIDGLKLAFTYILSTRGIPVMYYGDEIAMRGGDDPDNRKDFPGGWKDEVADAFDPAKRTQEERDVFDYVRNIALIRQHTPELRTGKLTQLGMGRDVYVFTRGSLIVLINNGAAPVKVEAPASAGTWKDLLDVSVNVAVHGNILSVTVPAQSAMIMEQRK